ncbi:MAG TPA: cation:dicarboxylase symporter family transporter [Thermotogota bacterium]|nr:cation:dicarboxylase symporter family transporter [Thermotogota bacterium]HRW35612.1 cation:dicarboxylase symporter family transporter [Thermotogota bacterium]
MKSNKTLIIMTITFLFFCSLILSSESDGMKRIRESGELRILMAKDDWWPFFYTDVSGELSGIDITVAERICETLSVQPVFIRKDSFNQLASSLNNGEGDVIISYYSYTPQRNIDVYLTSSYINSADSFLINTRVLERLKSENPVISPENLMKALDEERFKIGTVRGTSHELWAQELFDKSAIILYEPSQIEQMLTDREIDAFYFDELWTKFFLTVNPEFYLNYSLYTLNKADRIVIGVSPANLSLYHWLENYITTNLNMDQIIDEMYAEHSKGLADYFAKDEDVKPLIGDPWQYIILVLLLGLAFILIYITQKKQDEAHRQNWLFNFWTIIFSMIIGLYCGAVFPAFVDFLSPFGDIFFNYLLLFGIPILFFVVVINFIKLMMKMDGMRFFFKFMRILLLLFFIGSLIGVAVGVVGQPGSNLSKENRQQLAQAMQDSSDEKLNETIDLSAQTLFWKLPNTMVQDSLLKPFLENQTLAILFFAILCAFGLKFQTSERRGKIINAFETLNELFMFLFKLSYYFLPFGLFALMLPQARLFIEDAGMLSAFLKFTLCQFVILGVWFVISICLGSYKTKVNPWKYLQMIKKPTLILFSLMSTIAAIPPALEVCDKYPQFNDETIKGTLPLILVMMVPSITSTFAITTVFLIQLTGLEIGLMHYIFILVGSVGATFATIGVPAPVDLFAISIVVSAFGIPASQAVFFLLPWTLTAARFEMIHFAMLDFGVVQYFKPKEKEKD